MTWEKVSLDELNSSTLEDCIEEMEKIKSSLDKNDLPLEKMIELYCYGKDVVKIAQKKLNDIEFKYEVVESGKK